MGFVFENFQGFGFDHGLFQFVADPLQELFLLSNSLLCFLRLCPQPGQVLMEVLVYTGIQGQAAVFDGLQGLLLLVERLFNIISVLLQLVQ